MIGLVDNFSIQLVHATVKAFNVLYQANNIT